MSNLPEGQDGLGMAEAVRSGAVSAAELVEASIERIERRNPSLNAVIHPLFEDARRRAREPLPNGPFRGVPMLLKDLFCHTAGDPYHAGMRFLRDRQWRAKADTYLAARLRDAGFLFVGRTNVPELGPIPTTEPLAYGPTRNPWDLSRTPGGSSGGSAAAVAAGMVPLAHGNDGGGSIRVPASATGLFGLKPSRGRTSLGPDFGESWNGAVAEHVLTVSVRDSAAVLDAVSGWLPGDPYGAPPPSGPFLAEVGRPPGSLRIGLLADVPGGLAAVDPDCRAAVSDAVRLLESLGHRVEDAFPEALGNPEFQAHFTSVVMSWTAHDVEAWGREVGETVPLEELEPYTAQLVAGGRAIPATSLVASTVWLQGFTRRVAEWWKSGFDLLLTPTMACLPPRLGEMVSTIEDPLRGMMASVPMVAFTAPFNVTGQPAMSVPLFWNGSNLPVGVQLVGAYGREDLLFRLAAQLEEARPWAGRRPPQPGN